MESIERFMRNEVLPVYGNTHTTSSETGAQTTSFREEARHIIAEAVNANKVRRTDKQHGFQALEAYHVRFRFGIIWRCLRFICFKEGAVSFLGLWRNFSTTRDGQCTGENPAARSTVNIKNRGWGDFVRRRSPLPPLALLAASIGQ